MPLATSLLGSTFRLPVWAPEGRDSGAVNGAGTSRIRVLLADDHKILREGIASLLNHVPDIEVVGQAEDGVSAVELARQLQPDVIVMDVTMPRLNGIEATRQITNEQSDVRVIGLSMHEEEDMASALLDAGAASYLTKGGPANALIEAIRQAGSPREPASEA